MQVEPQAEHAWLRQMVGTWQGEMEAQMGPDEPMLKLTSTDTVRAIGDVWVMAEGQGEMPDGGVATNIMTLGYDPAKKKYVGNFIGSVMTHLWVYEGERDASGRLVLNTTGPNFDAPGTYTQYQDIIEYVTPDHRTLTARMQTADGQWVQIMKVDYRRV